MRKNLHKNTKEDIINFLRQEFKLSRKEAIASAELFGAMVRGMLAQGMSVRIGGVGTIFPEFIRGGMRNSNLSPRRKIQVSDRVKVRFRPVASVHLKLTQALVFGEDSKLAS